MDAKKKKSIVIWVSVAALLGVGGYFAYIKLIKPKLDEMKAKKAAEEAAKQAASLGSTPAPNSGSTPSSGGSSSAPLYPDDTRKFQDWMDANRPNWVGATNAALNNGRQLNKGFGYGNFGTSTTKAYNKYGDDWRKSLNVTPPTPPPTSFSGFNAIGKKAFVNPRLAFANIWSRPEIVTGFGSTFVGQINKPSIIGKIKNATYGGGFLWYEVDLLTPPSSSTAGYGQGNPYLRTGWVAALSTEIK